MMMMMKALTLAAAALALLAVGEMAAAAPDATSPCSFNGVDYASLSSKTDWTFEDNLYWYEMNICAVVNEVSTCQQKGGMACQFNVSNHDQVIASMALWKGATTTVQWSKIDSGVSGLWSNGDICDVQGADVKRTLKLDLVCGEENKIKSIENIPPTPEKCQADVTFTTPAVCGHGGPPAKSGGLSGGWVFCIILWSVTFVYCGLGCIYNRTQKGASGKEVIPHVAFWGALPGLVKDGCSFTVRKLRALCEGGNSSEYTEV
eukprot:TRINITY_DN65642_c1_g1_i1.p1 TRINITY_DN65642_c1_g1~~TRINITY_DN65642_c1_g1_i1.p1  ORF type:complete len:273 (-),score=126.76 TRINITY_DN65642_c1_g1_i1:84-866(-)